MKNTLSRENKRLNYLISETDAAYHEIAVKLGISNSAMQILYTLCDNDNSCLLQDICHSTGLSKQTINSALRKLEQEHLVTLEKTNAKCKKVNLTEEGLRRSEQTAIRLIELENEIMSSWSHEEVESYISLTEKYLIDLKEKACTL